MKKLFFPIILLFLHSILAGQFISPVPTGEILPHKSVAVSVTGKMIFHEDPYPNYPDFAIGVGLFNKFEIEFVSYTKDAYALNCTYLFMDETRSKPRIAFGIDNITSKEYISSFGLGEDTKWEKDVYSTRNTEQFSIFGVMGKHFGFSDISVGIGRGKYVGYGERTKNLNTDSYLDTPQNNAFGIFLDWEIFNFRGFKPYFSIDGRNYDYGLKYDHDYISIKAGVITPNSLKWYDRQNSLYDFGLTIYSKLIFRKKEITDIGILKGRVYDEKTTTSLNATITITGKNYYNKMETFTVGSYTIELKEGIYNIHASCEGYYWKEKTVRISSEGILYCNFKMKKKPF